MNLELLLEAERRGILPDSKKAIMAELRRRGKLPPLDGSTASGITPESLPAPDMNNLSRATDSLAPMDRFDRDGYTKDMLKGKVGPGMTAAQGFAQGLSFGTSDEIAGGLNAVKGALQGKNMKNAYAEGRDASRAVLDVGRDENPKTALAAEIAGGVLSPASKVGAGALMKASTPGKRIATGGLLGTLGGSGYGFAAGEGGAEKRLENAKSSAVASGVLGALVPAGGSAAKGAGKYIKQRKANADFAKAAPTADELFSEADALYTAHRASGARASGNEVGSLRNTVRDRLRKEGILTQKGKILRPYKDAKAALDFLDDYAETGMTADDLLTFRSTVSDMANTPVKKTSRAMGKIKEDLDNFISTRIPDHKKAVETSARGHRTKLLEKADETAVDRGNRYYTQAGYEHATRAETEKVLKKIRDGKLKGYSPEQIAQMEHIVNGGKVENIMRRVGQTAPKNPFTASAGYSLPAMGAYSMGVPPELLAGGTAALYGLGRGAAVLGDKMQGANASVARAMTATGQTPPQVAPPQVDGLLNRLLLLGAIPGQQ